MDPVVSLQSAGHLGTGEEKVGASEEAKEEAEQGVGQGLGQQEGGGLRKRFLYRLPDPTRRKDIEYYRDPAHRGYLSHTLPEGHGPSLFFNTPGTRQKAEKAANAKSGEKAAENRIW